jgi:prepilin-type N-terminal cleavage/methylation domain-containing protein
MMIRIWNYNLFKNQPGFTLIETVVALAISTAIIAGTVVSLNHLMFRGNDIRENMDSTQFVQNTGNWVRRDVLMTQSIEAGDNPATAENETMTLYWTGASRKDGSNDCIDYYEVSYYIDSEELRRKEHVTTEVYNDKGQYIETIEDETVAFIADGITDFSIMSEGASIVLSFAALVGDTQAEKTYEITPRAIE